MTYLTMDRPLIESDGSRGCIRIEGGPDGKRNVVWHGEGGSVIYDGPVDDLVAAAEAALTLGAQHKAAMKAAWRVTPIKITHGHIKEDE